MTQITFQRASEYINAIRKYTIVIDDKEWDTLGNGATKTITIPPGIHTIYAKIDWCQSPKITLECLENEPITLKIGSFKYGNRLIPIALILFITHLILSLVFNFNDLIYLYLIIFLIMIYYITFGRNKYLTIKEVKNVP